VALSALESGIFLTGVLSLVLLEGLELVVVPYSFARTPFFFYELASLATKSSSTSSEVLFFLVLVAAFRRSGELLSPS
jgi:hypothetical protein